MCECPALQQQQEQQIQPVIQVNNKKLSSASSMESNSFPLFQAIKLICIGCCLTTITNFPSAFMHTSVNTAVTELNAYLNQSYQERGNAFEEQHFSLLRSILNSCWYAGQIAGALCSPYLCDKYGRKPAYLLSTAMMTFACALQMLATLFPYPEMLILGRILASIFSPMSDTVAILYLQEISPPHLRGALSSLFATGYSAMGMLGMLLGIRRILGHSLTLLFFVPVLPGLVAIIFLAWIPETPKFLIIAKQDHEGACKSLEFYQGPEAVTEHALKAYQQEAKDEPLEQGGSMLSLFMVPYLRKALLLSLMAMVPTLAFYPILQSSTYFMLSLHVSKPLAQLSSSLMMALLTLCCILAAFLLDTFPRRSLLIWFGCGSIASLALFICSAVFAPFWHWFRFGAIAGMMLYIVCYGLAIGPISYFIAPELVPMQHRSSMFCLCFSLISGLIVFTNFATLPLYEWIGPITFGPLFILPSALALLYLWLYLPETKGKETHQIVALLKSGRQRINSERQILGTDGA